MSRWLSDMPLSDTLLSRLDCFDCLILDQSELDPAETTQQALMATVATRDGAMPRGNQGDSAYCRI